jgi:hypothetical protein
MARWGEVSAAQSRSKAKLKISCESKSNYKKKINNKINYKNKINCDGQECPSYTGVAPSLGRLPPGRLRLA